MGGICCGADWVCVAQGTGNIGVLCVFGGGSGFVVGLVSVGGLGWAS